MYFLEHCGKVKKIFMITAFSAPLHLICLLHKDALFLPAN
jgi:hypothetical protein